MSGFPCIVVVFVQVLNIGYWPAQSTDVVVVEVLLVVVVVVAEVVVMVTAVGRVRTIGKVILMTCLPIWVAVG